MIVVFDYSANEITKCFVQRTYYIHESFLQIFEYFREPHDCTLSVQIQNYQVRPRVDVVESFSHCQTKPNLLFSSTFRVALFTCLVTERAKIGNHSCRDICAPG